MTSTTIKFGESFDEVIKSYNREAQKMTLLEIASNFRGGGFFDLKANEAFANTGVLLNGKYVSIRSAGNYLAGYNAEGGTFFKIGVSFETFQKLAGALHVMESQGKQLANSQKTDIMLNGTSYGPPPTYGELYYQYRMSRAGWNQSNYNKRKL